MTELLLAFALGLAFGLVLSAVFIFVALFFHHYRKIMSDKEQIYGNNQENTNEADTS